VVCIACRILMDVEYKKRFAILFTKVCMQLLIVSGNIVCFYIQNLLPFVDETRVKKTGIFHIA